MDERRIELPLTAEVARSLRAGDRLLLTGMMYTGRDAAHKRLIDLIERGEPLPFDPAGQLIYYVGPAPARPGQAVGPAGPTSSYRMDSYTPRLIELGLRGMMGKGVRGPEVVAAMRLHGAVYLGVTGGAAALIAQRIVKCELCAFPDLGAEAIYRFTVADFPALTLIDSLGNNLYESGPARYRQPV